MTTFLAVLCLGFVIAGHADAGDVVRRPVSDGVYASMLNGRERGADRLGLEISIPANESAQRFLQRFLAIESEWVAFRGANRTFIPADRLKEDVRREVLLTLFPDDVVDENGWRHTVTYPGETLYSLAEWITGSGKNHGRVVDASGEPLSPTALKPGQTIVIPAALLSPVMRAPSPVPEPKPVDVAAEGEEETSAVRQASAESDEPVALDGVLEYGTDKHGAYAAYKLGRGEALYTGVVVRFTDLRDNADILKACEAIAARTGIRDVRDIDAGATIRIPIAMLSDRFMPADSPERRAYLASLEESERLRATPALSRDLEDVVVILDPGHGGTDHGAFHTKSGLYEDEINYDIVCRIKKILESETGAKVYVTLTDKSQGFESTDATRFKHDGDEELLTNPPYRLQDATVGVNLRYMLVNSIYERERQRGIDSRKIVFSSIHTDSLFNASLRGTMVYIPGAKWRRSSEYRSAAVYARYEEGRTFNRFTSTAAERRRDEALSRNFAHVVLDELGKKRVKRHDKSDPIRSQISGRGKKPWVPGVIRNTKVPTKVLIETANLNSPVDRQRLADPWWREQFAKAYVDALRRHFDVSAKGVTRQGMEAD